PSEAGELVVPDGAEMRDRLDQIARRLTASLRERAVSARRHLQMLADRRVLTRPFDRLLEHEIELDEWQRRLTQAIRVRRQRCVDEIARIAGSLNALSPLSVLERGYSITQTADGTVVKDSSQVEVGKMVTTRLHR